MLLQKLAAQLGFQGKETEQLDMRHFQVYFCQIRYVAITE